MSARVGGVPRKLYRLSHQTEHDKSDIPIPPGQEQNPLVQVVNQSAVNFDQTFNESLWATYPNPFMDYNDEMKGVSELLLVCP